MSPDPVCVLYTGGTIGTRHLDLELHPGSSPMLSTAEVDQLLRQRAGLSVDFSIMGPENGGPNPVVSSQIIPSDWAAMARMVERHYDHFGGFVILHGTDTLAWTASALSFMLRNLGKPVVVTGAQRPISAAPSDAVSNFVNSVLLAGGHLGPTVPTINEVVVCFGGRVVRGNRSQKVSAASVRGFDSPNAPRLGRIGRTVEIDARRLEPAPTPERSFYVDTMVEPDVVDIGIFPGMTAKQLSRSMRGARGVVLRTFGAGNVPDGLAKPISQAISRGAVIVNVTQCPEGTVESGMLSGSQFLARLGVVTGLDLTPEAAFTKLMVLLGNDRWGFAASRMRLDACGEQSYDCVELSGSAVKPKILHRISLTADLHARVVLRRLESAVLRLGGIHSGPLEAPVRIEAWLNNGAPADPPSSSANVDPRFVGERSDRHPDQSFDLTHAARAVLRTGDPVWITLRSSAPTMIKSVTATFFVTRSPTSA